MFLGFRVDTHGAKLQESKRLAGIANTLLLVKNRPGRDNFDEGGND